MKKQVVLKQIIITVLIIYCGVLLHGQNNNILILNGAKIVLIGGQKDTCINLVINQPNVLGIKRNSGYIVSENQFNYVKWHTGTAMGTYVIPFGVEDDYIPFSFAKKNGDVSVSFSTWGTSPQNMPHPEESSVAGVGSMTEETDSIVYAIDRFWDIVANGAVSADITFSYRGIENTTETPQSIVKAQHWNGSSWDAPAGQGNVGVINGVGTVGPISNITTFSPWVLVINSPCTPSYNYVNEEICNGESIYLDGEFQTEPGVYYDIIYEGSVSGCDSIIETTLTVNENPYFNSISITDVTTCTEPYDGEIVVGATGGSVPYEFSFEGGGYSTNTTYGGLNAGAYIIDVRDTNGCSSDTVAIVENNTGFYIDSVMVSDLSCYGDANGQLVIYAENAVSYSIDNGATYSGGNTFTDLTADVYYVLAKDAGGCTDVFVAYITEPDVIEIMPSHTDAICGENNGSANVSVSGGIPPYSYLWSNSATSSLINNIEQGTYGITVTDANGCTMSETVVVGNTGNNIELGSPSFSNIDCYGNENAWIKLNITEGTGPFTISWSNSMSTDSIFNLGEGSYSVTVSEPGGCFATGTYTINEPDSLSLSETITDVSCTGNNDGQILVIIEGGTTPYSFVWSTTPEQTDTLCTGLVAGEYTLTVTDSNSCSKVKNYTVLDGVISCADADLIIPTIFTPNNDGINDTWELKGINAYTDVEITIYSRAGELIFEYSGSGAGYDGGRWDGTYNGDALSMSSYIFTIDLKDDTDVIKGIVTIKK